MVVGQRRSDPALVTLLEQDLTQLGASDRASERGSGALPATIT